ncbi:hypothetical protein Hte_005740 [Hypoxylon texense]
MSPERKKLEEETAKYSHHGSGCDVTTLRQVQPTESPSVSLGAGSARAVRQDTAVVLYRPGGQTLSNPTIPTKKLRMIQRQSRRGTIYGMSILHRSQLASPIPNFRLKPKYVEMIEFLLILYGNLNFPKCGAPKTAWDFAHVLLGCSRKFHRAERRVMNLWGPVNSRNDYLIRLLNKIEEDEANKEDEATRKTKPSRKTSSHL